MVIELEILLLTIDLSNIPYQELRHRDNPKQARHSSTVQPISFKLHIIIIYASMHVYLSIGGGAESECQIWKCTNNILLHILIFKKCFRTIHIQEQEWFPEACIPIDESLKRVIHLNHTSSPTITNLTPMHRHLYDGTQTITAKHQQKHNAKDNYGGAGTCTITYKWKLLQLTQ